MEIACAKLSGPEGIVGQCRWVGANASIVESRRIGEGATVGIGNAVIKNADPGITAAVDSERSIAEMTEGNEAIECLIAGKDGLWLLWCHHDMIERTLAVALPLRSSFNCCLKYRLTIAIVLLVLDHSNLSLLVASYVALDMYEYVLMGFKQRNARSLLSPGCQVAQGFSILS